MLSHLWLRFRASLRVLWAYFRAFLRVLWACRVSVVAVVLPFILFLLSPAARDLFSYFAGQMTVGGYGAFQPDLLAGEIRTAAYWLSFTLLCTLFWAYPVHFSARIILNFPEWIFPTDRKILDDELIALRTVYRPFIVWVPRILGASVFLVLAWGAYRAIGDVPGAGLYERLGIGTASSGEIVGVLYFLVALFLFSAALVFAWFSQMRGNRMQAAASELLPDDAPLLQRYRRALGDGERIAEDVKFGHASLGLVTLGFWIVFFAADWMTRVLYLALVLPIVLGAWVPLLTLLARFGHRWRWPLITTAIVGVASVAWLSGDWHDVTRAEPHDSSSAKVRARDGIDAAIGRWKAANGCQSPSSCPRPIVVSTAGGASRAAFFTVTVLGDLLDHPVDPRPSDEAERATLSRRAIDRIFAISGVSGGSAGAMFYAAAVANAPDGRHPCRSEPSHFWFRAGPPMNWRDCLQMLAAEDFLSATILGLAIRDSFGVLGRMVRWPDRAARLEQAWIEAFALRVKPGQDDRRLGLDRPFTAFGPSQVGDGGWRPLLVLNGTSVTTGRRILTSHVAPEGRRVFMDGYDLYEFLSGTPACIDTVCKLPTANLDDVTLASAATNSARFPVISPAGTLRNPDGRVLDRIVDGGYFENDGITTTIDLVRALRKAGLRPAVIHIANDPLPYPRSTARRGAMPMPETEKPPWDRDSPVLPDAEDRAWFLFLRAPIGSLFATRSARATYALTDIQEELLDRTDLAEILVYGETPATTYDKAEDKRVAGCALPSTRSGDTRFRNVAMSWWLSQPVQQYLDTQLLLERNCIELERIRGWLAEAAAPEPQRTPEVRSVSDKDADRQDKLTP